MCGIAGLFVQSTAKRTDIGRMFTAMLEALTERGPDSAGIAVYRDPVELGWSKYSLCAAEYNFNWTDLEQRVAAELTTNISITATGRYAIVRCEDTCPRLDQWLASQTAQEWQIQVVGVGSEMEIYKDVGDPGQIAQRYAIAEMQGSCMIGHTRMATESAVNLEGSHPFTAGPDLCVVHNGSYANHNTIRRELAREGVACDSWNDTEVGARFLQWRLAEGDDLDQAIQQMMKQFSGFFTLAIGLKDQFAVVRDPYACKPLVVAETDDYVACGSEFRALASLPGIKDATLFEPKPEGVYVWSA